MQQQKKRRFCLFEMQSKLKLMAQITNWSNWISPSGATKLCTMNLCLFFSFGSKLNGCKQTIGTHQSIFITLTTKKKKHFCNILAMSIISFACRVPQLGRTQYFFGAVVLILNKIVLSVGFLNFIYDVMDWLNGPAMVKIETVSL